VIRASVSRLRAKKTDLGTVNGGRCAEVAISLPAVGGAGGMTARGAIRKLDPGRFRGNGNQERPAVVAVDGCRVHEARQSQKPNLQPSTPLPGLLLYGPLRQRRAGLIGNARTPRRMASALPPASTTAGTDSSLLKYPPGGLALAATRQISKSRIWPANPGRFAWEI
jgi:hypothetical protein